jgi:hypothetical protein
MLFTLILFFVCDEARPLYNYRTDFVFLVTFLFFMDLF